MMRFVIPVFTASLVFVPQVEGIEVPYESSTAVSEETSFLQAAANAKSAAVVGGVEEAKASSCQGFADFCLDPEIIFDVSVDSDLSQLDAPLVLEPTAPAFAESREDEPDQEFVSIVRQTLWLLSFAMASKGAMNCRRPQTARKFTREPADARVNRSADMDVNPQRSALHKAALAGNDARCESLLRRAPDALATPDAWGTTALHAAATGGAHDVVALFLERGTPVDPVNSWDETPLHLAARAGHVAVCEMLVRNGASLRAANAEDRTPLVVAGYEEQDEVCRALLGLGADVDGVPDRDVPEFLRDLMAR